MDNLQPRLFDWLILFGILVKIQVDFLGRLPFQARMNRRLRVVILDEDIVVKVTSLGLASAEPLGSRLSLRLHPNCIFKILNIGTILILHDARMLCDREKSNKGV